MERYGKQSPDISGNEAKMIQCHHAPGIRTRDRNFVKNVMVVPGVVRYWISLTCVCARQYLVFTLPRNRVGMVVSGQNLILAT